MYSGDRFKLPGKLDLLEKDIQNNPGSNRLHADRRGIEQLRHDKRLRQAFAFKTYIFNLYSQANPRELEMQSGFTISRHNLNNIRYSDDTVLMAEAEMKL